MEMRSLQRISDSFLLYIQQFIDRRLGKKLVGIVLDSVAKISRESFAFSIKAANADD